ncbi:MAG: alpha-ketoacid dehydrogenase subunit beta [Lentisphaeria bacterium]|nr:alpha-ketoacid dehydrogenase subunit beta [Lentisphaeria bacterium]
MSERVISYTDALREALAEEMARDETVFLMGEDIAEYGGAFGVTRGLLDQFGRERVVNTPISEPGFTGLAIGAAMTGTRPVVELMFMDFLPLVADQLLNMAGKLRYVFGEQAGCPLVIRAPGGAGRCYGPTHSQNLEAWLLHSPGIKIVCPSTPADAKGLLKSAIRDPDPVFFMEHKMLYPTRDEVPENPDLTVPFGQARKMCDGEDITIVAWSWMAALVDGAALELEKLGVYADALDLRTLVPMDMEAVVASVKKTGRLMIVEEAVRTGGVAAEIACRVFERAYDCLAAPVHRLTLPDIPISASPLLEAAALPSVEKIIDMALDLVDG